MITATITNKVNPLRAFLALTKASVINTMRNPTSLFFNFVFPFIFIGIFGSLNYSNVTFDLGVKNSSLKEGPVYEALQKVSVIKLVTDKTDAKMNEDLTKGNLAMVIDIQKDQPLIVAPGQEIPRYKLTIEKSAASPDSASTINSILENITNQINFSMIKPGSTLVTSSSTEVAGRKYETIDFILPGQLAFALLTNALFGISFTFVTMKKELVLKRFFATPIKKEWIMGSEIFAKILVAIIQTVLILTVGHYLFKFTLANGFETILSMLVLAIIGIFTFLSFGLFTAAISKNEDSVTPISQLIMMPQLFLSGAFFAIEAFPSFIQPIAKILPMTLLNDAFKMVAFEGAPLTQALPQIGGMLLWAVVIYLIAARLFKWE